MIETKTLHIMKNIKTIFFVVLLINLYALMIKLTNQLLYIEDQMRFIN